MSTQCSKTLYHPNGMHATWFIVACNSRSLARAPRAPPFSLSTTSCRLLKAQGKQKSRRIGQHASDTALAGFFSDIATCQRYASAGPARRNKGLVIMMKELPRERLGIAAQAGPAAERWLEADGQLRAEIMSRKGLWPRLS